MGHTIARTYVIRGTLAAALLAASALATSAQAGGVNWSIHLGVPGAVVGASNVVTYPAYPIYTPAPPVVVSPAPVYVQPRPVVLPAPVYYPAPPQPAWHGGSHRHHHGHPGHGGHHANWGGQPVVWAPAHNLGHSAILAPHPRWNPPAYQQWSHGEAP